MNELSRTLEDVGNAFTLELCQMYQELGLDCIWNDGKDLTLVDKKEDLSAATE